MFAGEHWSRPASFEIGIWALATLELSGPMTATVGLVGDDLAHVVRAGLRIVRAVERVVVDRRVRDFDRVAAGGAAGLLHREA